MNALANTACAHAEDVESALSADGESFVVPRGSETGGTPVLQFTLAPEEATAAVREGIPVESLKEVRVLLECMRRIHRAGKVRREAKRLAAALENRWAAETLVQKYYLFARGNEDGDRLNVPRLPAGHWRLLLNRAKAPAARKLAIALKYSFYEFWRALGEENQRAWSSAHTELVQIWKTGFGFPRSSKGAKRYTKIPGYSEWPVADAVTGLPEGWTLGNLMRHVSDPYDQSAARVGRSKAAEQRLPVLTTRTKLRFGQYFEFDDHEFNQKVMFQRKPMRPLGFGAVEVLSGCLCLTGYKPTLWDFEEAVRRKLTEREFMWFVIAFLCGTGYRRDEVGTTLIVERGTAAIRDEFRERLERVLGGKVKVEVGGRFGRPAHAGQFHGRSHGNFRTKALIEGMWSLVDNQMGALPAQTGKDRNHAPEQLHGIEQYTSSLVRRAEGLSDERKALLAFPCPTFSLWRDWALDAVHRINGCRQHALEGWEKLGFVQPVWRLDETSTQWLPMTALAKLSPEQQAVARGLMEGNPNLMTSVRLNRQEVFNAGRCELTAAPLELLPELVGLENAVNGGAPVPVLKGLLTIDDGEIDSDPLRFYARDCTRSHNGSLPNGEKYICFLNPYDPRALVACELNSSGRLKVVAVCPRYELANKADEKEIQVLMGEQSAFEGAARQRLNLRHAGQAADKEALQRHNENVFSDRPITPQEKVRARKQAAAQRRIANSPADIRDLVQRKDAKPQSREGQNSELGTPNPERMEADEQEEALKLLK